MASLQPSVLNFRVATLVGNDEFRYVFYSFIKIFFFAERFALLFFSFTFVPVVEELFVALLVLLVFEHVDDFPVLIDLV